MNLLRKSPLGLKLGKPKRNRERLARVKMLPCIVCGAPPPSDAHHVICGRYSQHRASDDETVPLCKQHHQWGPDAIHNGKESWVEKYGPDYAFLPEVDRLLSDRLDDEILGTWF